MADIEQDRLYGEKIDFGAKFSGGLCGFSTAGGKKMAISDTAMAKAQSLFGDLDKEETPHNFDDVGFGFGAPKNDVKFGGGGGGFSTAGGKKMIISETALAKAQSLFGDLDKEETPHNFEDVDFGGGFIKNDVKAGGFGFSTAGGKKMAISENAMAKAQSLFGDLDKDETDQNDFDTPNLENRNGHQSNFLKASSAFKTPTILPIQKKINDSHSTTPKLPPASKFNLGRRRLANSPPPASTSGKKKRMDIFSQINAMEEDELPLPLPAKPSGLSSSAIVLSTLPTKRKTFFQYGTPNGRKQTTPPILFSNRSLIEERLKLSELSDNSDQPKSAEKAATSVIAGNTNGKHKHCEPGQLYRLRKNAVGQRRTLAVELAGQTPRRYDFEEYERYGVKKATLQVNSQNAGTFEFTQEYFGDQNFDLTIGDGVVLTRNDDGNLSADDFIRAFINSSIIESSLISDAWCQNHYRWIVWKEASMEIGFPHLFGGKLLTPDRVMLQLKYRYDREIEKAERPALKKILNGDDTTYRPMVLCVSAIVMDREIDAIIELTDGWYSVKACLDQLLSQKLANGQIFIGQKLFINRCSISGLEGGCEPLEVPASVQLTLTANNVRRAKWNANLGYQYLKRLPHFSLSSLVVGGGMTSGIKVIVRRIFPMQYMAKNSNGRVMVLDEKAEAKEARLFEECYERCLDRLVADIEKQFMTDSNTMDDQAIMEKAGSKLNLNSQEIRATCDVEDLYRIFINAADPSAVEARATPAQKERLKAFCQKMNEQRIFEYQQKFENAIRDKAALLPQRKVTPLVKIRAAGCHATDIAKNVESMLTIWRPDDDMLYHIKEGAAYLVTSVQITQASASWENCKFALATTAETRFIPLGKKKPLLKP